MKTVKHPDVIVIAIYRPPTLALSSLLAAIRSTFEEHPSSQVIIIGDFNVNWLDEIEQRSLHNLMINENGLEQFISTCTTGHVYTNLMERDELLKLTSVITKQFGLLLR